MDVSIPINWWLAPALFTIGAFWFASTKTDNSPAGDYGRIGQGMANAFVMGVALIASLSAWLIWALFA